MTTCARAGGCAWLNYPFLTSKERDIETGLDYFLARYYSSTQGRFTSPDEFKGGPEELFGEVDPHDPLFYADTAEPQSLNKYHYALNNPLRYIDPDGHQTTTADNLKQAAGNVAGFVTSAWRGEAKGVANIVIGASNIGGEAIGNPQTASYEPKNSGEAYGMRVVEVLSVFGGLLSGKGPASVMLAETKPTTAVAAEVGNATRGTKTATQMAADLSAQTGKTSVAYTTPNKKGHIDLKDVRNPAGHFDKATGQRVKAPTVQERSIHVGANAQVNLGKQTTRPATKQDIRTARKLIEQQ